MIKAPIFHICISDTDPAPIKSFYNSWLGIKLLRELLIGFVPKESYRLERVLANDTYRISMYILGTDVEKAIDIGTHLEDLYRDYKENIYGKLQETS